MPRLQKFRIRHAQIRAGERVFEEYIHKKCQKDADARWTKKNGQTFYGYKDQVKSDTKSKRITDYRAGVASAHDSQQMEDLPDTEDGHQPMYADAACTGEEIEKALKQQEPDNQICEKGRRNAPLKDPQKQHNSIKSNTR